MNRAKSRQRQREIAQILTRNGFEWLWSKWKIGAILGAAEKSRDGQSATTHSQPERLRLTLEQLGTTFIKIGQMLSTRPDLLPPEYIFELSKLQDDAPKVPYEAIADAIEQEFGARPEAIFKTFDAEARAAGSIAQVHNATLPDGTAVVVKVRRPGVDLLVEQDLAVLGEIARFLTHHTDVGRKYEPENLLDEFAYTLRNELDFTREGQNAERIAAEFSDDSSVHVPAIFSEFSGRTVLTMEAISGIKIDDLKALDEAGVNRHELAQKCAHIALVQVLDYGFFHADPHPGNFFVLPDGAIALIDYGMVGRLGERLRESLIRLALAVSRHDSERLLEELLALGAAKRHVDRAALSRDLDRLLSEYDGVAIGEISVGKIFREVSATAQKHELRLPSDLMLLARVIAMDEGMGAHLDPEFNLMEFSKPYFERFWRKSHSLPEIGRLMKEGAIDLADLGRELPHRLHRLASMIERGDLTVTSRVDLPDQLVKKFERTGNRISISILMAGLIVGLSVLVQVYRPSGAVQIGPWLLSAFLVVALLTGVWLLSAFWKSEK